MGRLARRWEAGRRSYQRRAAKHAGFSRAALLIAPADDRLPMLIELAIKNFAIIDSVQIPFGPGLNVLTGETGAGKSILIDALGSVLGQRVSPEMVRSGERAAAIEATFDLSNSPGPDALADLLAELQAEPEEGLLILSREIQASGRSSARLNGRPATASILAQIGALLVDIHGQSDHLSLLKPAIQIDLLDRFGGLMAERGELAAKFAALRQARGALAEASSGARDRMQRIDLLGFQVDEIRAAGLEVGEEEALASERSRLANAETLVREASAAYATIAGGDDEGMAALPGLRQAAQTLHTVIEMDPTLRGAAERLAEAVFLLEDVAAETRTYRDVIEADPQRLAAVDERLADIRQLKRKYGADIAEVLAYAENAESELEALTGSEMSLEALTERAETLAREVGFLADGLSARRQAAALKLAERLEQTIADLNMGSAAFEVALTRSDDPRGVPVRTVESGERVFAVDATGIDRAEFLIAPNLGEGLKPLSKIASGGETARLTLALKSILSEVDQTPTLLFDEIDVGVGGRSGQVVGEKLYALGKDHQVIAITHLPQIAAFADAHFQIVKSALDERVVSTVRELCGAERETELAAMLDGMPVSPSALKSAQEMLERASAMKMTRLAAR